MKEMDRLIEIMKTLRAPGGCPWDAEQDHRSLLPNLIEEAYELAEAIEKEDASSMEEELGDVLLQVVFHSIIAAETDRFSFSDVVKGLCKKLIYRHPHVFGDSEVADSGEVMRNWDRLKNGEKGKKDRKAISDGIPKALPVVLYALKLQIRAQRSGFDWDDSAGVMEKIKEETRELEEALGTGEIESTAAEIGDLIFSAVNLARKLQIDPEAAVRGANKRFVQRFAQIEKAAASKGLEVGDMSMDEKERIWQQAK